MRQEREILEAEGEFFDKVRHDRHMLRKQQVDAGESDIDPAIWERPLAAAEDVRRSRGEENLGPYDDFERGIINGKLSALRWVLGEEWDMLDTYPQVLPLASAEGINLVVGGAEKIPDHTLRQR
jgi:hypothetical protein